MDANTGRFEVSVPFGDSGGIGHRGSYRIRPLYYDMVVEQWSSESGVEIATRSMGDEMWYQLLSITSEGAETAGWPCWVNHADVSRLGELPVELGQAPTGQPPGAIIAASYGTGTRFLDDQTIEGTTDLALVLSLVSAKFLVATGVDVQGDTTVPATFSLDGHASPW